MRCQYLTWFAKKVSYKKKNPKHPHKPKTPPPTKKPENQKPTKTRKTSTSFLFLFHFISAAKLCPALSGLTSLLSPQGETCRFSFQHSYGMRAIWTKNIIKNQIPGQLTITVGHQAMKIWRRERGKKTESSLKLRSLCFCLYFLPTSTTVSWSLQFCHISFQAH